MLSLKKKLKKNIFRKVFKNLSSNQNDKNETKVIQIFERN